ncbi:MAG: mannose-1-phosphate guanylyltransferase [Acidobacteria bacterium]|nr:mannose-1-phosphate guanylyltransferase [Acidobacteriota bacterium]MCA1620416.1 mannose-1-phosphate guanylyltransferase [Acidobacteriota bacterium]
MSEGLKAVFIAGGAGTRLWPMSRESRPKQFHALAGEASLMRQTVERVLPVVAASDVWVVTGERYAARTREELPEVPAGQIVGEPFPLGTNLAVGLGALHVARRDPDAVLFVGWADSYFREGEEFRRALLAAARAARETAGVIVGVRPTHAATGYGYIRAGVALAAAEGAYRIAGFEEKPSPTRAREFLADGSYLWNPGMSVWVASRLLELIRLHKPAHHEALMRVAPHLGTPRERGAMEEAFAGLDREPIDTAVFEKAAGLATVVTDPGWSDVGTWAAVYELAAAGVGERAGGTNVTRGEVFTLDTSGCLVHAAAGRPVFTLGVEDLVVVDAGDCLLVARRDQAERLKELHALAKRSGHPELL